MNSTLNPIPPRLIDLMVEQATQGLSPQDEVELQAAIDADKAIRAEAEAYALAATAVELTLTKPTQVEALPEALRQKLIATASEIVHTAQPELKLTGSATADKPATPPASFSFSDGKMFGWYAAIAALVALAFMIGQEPRVVEVEKIVEKEVPVEVERIVQVPAPDPVLPPLDQRYAALAQQPDTVTASWGFNSDGGDPAYANAKGEVIWNAEEQTGYMKLAGLPVNDPTEIQYQLWIVDGSRDTTIENTNRVDGGVFDITAEGEVIVPINAKLLARNAAAFAITVERPGGVVESKGPLQALAVVEKS